MTGSSRQNWQRRCPGVAVLCSQSCGDPPRLRSAPSPLAGFLNEASGKGGSEGRTGRTYTCGSADHKDSGSLEIEFNRKRTSPFVGFRGFCNSPTRQVNLEAAQLAEHVTTEDNPARAEVYKSDAAPNPKS